MYIVFVLQLNSFMATGGDVQADLCVNIHSETECVSPKRFALCVVDTMIKCSD